MVLPEFVGWIEHNIRQDIEPQFVQVNSPELWAALPLADFLVVFESKITAEMIAAAPRLKLIQLPQVGYDNIDVAAASRMNVPVCNAPGLVAPSVAEHALMLILATLRRLVECDARVRQSEWPQLGMFQKGLHDFAGATLGIVGLGAIGRALARICRALAGTILYYNRRRLPPSAEKELGVTYAPLDELLRQSDVVSLHVPLDETTRGLIGAEQLSLMKPTAILVNTARGPVIDQDALIEHLRAGRLRGAAFDVLWEEPLPPQSPLLTFDNVLFTPHVASGSQETAWKAFEVTFENVYRVADGQAPLYRVNIPVGVKGSG
jgi:phosphoglycerate dehydrogenase-like enzyme